MPNKRKQARPAGKPNWYKCTFHNTKTQTPFIITNEECRQCICSPTCHLERMERQSRKLPNLEITGRWPGDCMFFTNRYK